MKFLLFLFPIILVGCSENELAKSFGGTMNVSLPCDQKLFDVTWKETSFWYVTRPMREGETPENYIFQEKSSGGFMEGSVHIAEHACQ